MLKTAFNRGDICWHRNRAHIVWRDDNGVAYDISGVFYDYEEGDLLSVENSLGNLLVDFKHTGEKYTTGYESFVFWCKHYKVSEVYAITNIYRQMPKEIINDELSVTENALTYWSRHSRELGYEYARRNHERVRKEINGE